MRELSCRPGNCARCMRLPCSGRTVTTDYRLLMLITDCHVHIQPLELFKPEALALMKKSRKDFDQVAEYCRSPKAF